MKFRLILQPLMATIYAILDGRKDAREWRVPYFWVLFTDLASYIDVPAVNLAEGSVYGLQRTSEQKRMFPPLLTGRCGPSAPGNAYVSANYSNQ